MVDSSNQCRFRFSIRSLMIVVAVFALVLSPILWTIQHQRLLVHAQERAAVAEKLAWAQEARARRIADRFAGAIPPGATGPAAGKSPGLWAALSVSHAVFAANEAKELVLEFTIVNDGSQPIDPEIDRSRIIINGKELEESGLILGNGPRDARFTSLPPGDSIRFTSRLGHLFKVSGTYRASCEVKRSRRPRSRSGFCRPGALIEGGPLRLTLLPRPEGPSCR